MTKRPTIRSRAVRRAAVVLAAAIGVSTVASTAGNAAPSPSVKEGGTLKVAIWDNMPGYCFGDNPGNSALMVYRTMYETLFERTATGSYVGLLASSGTPNANFQVWTVKLRTGIKFHNGQDFNAASVIKNLQYARGAAFLQVAGSAGRAAAVTAFGHTLGTAVPFLSNIAAIDPLGTHEVRFTLARPQHDFLGTLYGSGRFYMRADAQLEKATCSTDPIGTGPFKFVKGQSSARKVTVQANTAYWQKIGTKNRPYLDRIVFEMVKNSTSRSAGVQRGTYDIAMFSAADSGKDIVSLRRRQNLKEFRSAKEFFPVIWLNQGKAGDKGQLDSPFTNKNARLAVTYATDVASINRNLLAGQVDVPRSVVGRANVMYNTSGYRRFNLNLAKKAVADYKKETGKKTLSFTFPHDTSSQSKALAEELKRQWERAGMKVRLQSVETVQFLKKAFNSATAGNDFQLNYTTILEGPDTTFSVPFLASNVYTGRTDPFAGAFASTLGQLLSLTHHKATAVDLEFWKAQAQSKSAAVSTFKGITKVLQDEAVVVPMGSFAYSVFVGSKVDGVGRSKFPSGGSRRVVTNFGIDYANVYLK